MTKTQNRETLNKAKAWVKSVVKDYNVKVTAHNIAFKDTRKKLDLVNA